MVVGVSVIGLGLVPSAFQCLLVEPNEVTYETPYIRHSITFTRQRFRLDRTEVRRFPAVPALSREQIERSRDLLVNVRLWDWRALAAVYAQFQVIRLYHEFHDLDIDRYTIGDRVRQVMVAAREMEQANLPPQSRTFVNRRFKYTHGYGLTMVPVSEFTADGLPYWSRTSRPRQRRWNYRCSVRRSTTAS